MTLESAEHHRRKQAGLTLRWLPISIAVLIVALWSITAPSFLSEHVFLGRDLVEKLWLRFYEKLFAYWLLSPWFWSALVAALALQLVLPADKDQPFFGRGSLQDLAWVLYEAVASIILLGACTYWMKNLYDAHLSFMTLNILSTAPEWARVVLAILIRDWFRWLAHLIMHQVPALWRFHSLHHSQRELNFFTDYRFHVVDLLFQNCIMMIPLCVLQLEAPTILAYVLFERWYTRLYHANIRTNLGPLRYLLVTPQSHRIHHSLDPAHHNTNYGALFSIWDQIFGTQYRGYNEYPAAGLHHEHYPESTSRTWWGFLWNPIVQMAYSFRPEFGQTTLSEKQGHE